MGDTLKNLGSFEELPPLKIKAGSPQIVHFLEEERELKTKWGDKILFVVQVGPTKMNFWVSSKGYGLLQGLKAISNNGSIKGVTASISRTGETQVDTRYKVVKA